MEGTQNVSLSTIMDLPEDCLVFIFKRLSCDFDRQSFGLTCHRWLEIQNQNRQSLRFDCFPTKFMDPFSGTVHKIDRYKVHRTLTRFLHLKSLSLTMCAELLDSGLNPLQNYGSTLQAIHLDWCFRITCSGLSFVAAGCPSLTFISLYRCNVTDNGLETLAKGCLGLEVINLSYCSFITDQGIKPIVQHCVKLHAIRISFCERITGVGFRGCSQSLAYLEAESCKLVADGILAIVSGGGLNYLNIASLRWSIHGRGLATIGSGLGTRLRVLNMRLCKTIGDESVGAIAKGCPSLVDWNLAWCHEIRVGGWESIALNCHNLEKLHVNLCRNLCDLGLQALENGTRKLSILYMNGCLQVSEQAVESFSLARGDVVIIGEEKLELPADFQAVMSPSYYNA